MKTNLVKLMGVLVLSIVLGACSSYDDEIIAPPTTENTNNNDEKKDNDDKWETVMDDWYNIINNHTTIDSHKKTSKTEYIVNAPFSVSLGDSIYFTTEDKNESSFAKIHSIDPRNISYGDWYANEESDSIRSTTSTQVYECNLYNRNLVINNAEAFRFINGTRDPFEMPKIIVSFAGHSSKFEETEILRNDSIFSRENIKDSVKVSFGNRPDITSYYVSATATIDHFIKMKEQENEETMPEPTFYVDGEILSITDRTASPEFTASDKTHAIWYEVSVIKTSVKTYVVANGQLKDGWSNSDLANAEWNSAILDKGYTNKWVPATINMDGSGWTYVLQFSNNEYRSLTVPENLSLMTDLKTFKEDDNASQTPFLTKGVNKRHFANGDFYTVTGKYSYTVAAK